MVCSSLYILASFSIGQVTIGAWVYLWTFYISCSIDLYFCFCANTMLFWLLWLCNIIWSQGNWFLQLYFSFSRMLWLFRVFSVSISHFSSVAQSCPTLCDPMNCSTPGLPVHHQLLESTRTHVHWVDDAIQASYPLSSPSPPALNLSQHQGLFQWVSSSHQVAKVLEFQLQHQSFQWTPRTDLL